MYLDDKQRLQLLEVLEGACPNITDKNLRSLFLLLIASLCDNMELSIARAADAQRFLNQMKDVETSLRIVSKKMDGSSESDEMPEPKELVWQ